MTTADFCNDSVRIAAGLIASSLLALALACSDDNMSPNYSVPAAAGAAGTLNRGSGTLIPGVPRDPGAPGGGAELNNGGAGTPGIGIAGAAGYAGTGGVPGSGGAPDFGTAGTAGSFGYPSGGAAGVSGFGSAGFAGTAGTGGAAGF